MLYGNNRKEETNMKKILAFGLFLMLLCGCAALAADEGKTEMGVLEVTDAFTLQCSLPEGYWLNPTDTGSDHYRAVLMPQDESAGKPMMSISIQFNELMSDVERLNDLDSETLAALEATFREEDDVEISYMETTYGTKLMMVREIRDGTDYVDFYTIYKGYEIEFVLSYGMDAAVHSITDDQIQQAITFLSELDFVKK